MFERWKSANILLSVVISFYFVNFGIESIVLGASAQQTHKLIISKFPHVDIIESGEIQKRSLVTEDLVKKPDDKPLVVNLTTVSGNEQVNLTPVAEPVVDLAKPDKNFHITVDVVPESDEDNSKPREITLYWTGEFFFKKLLCLRTCNGYNQKPFPLLSYPKKK